MHALLLRDGRIRLERSFPEPEAVPGEALVRVCRAGICETDLQLVRGYMAFEGVLGHEFVGVAQNGPLAGERVVGEINCGCGACDLCRSGGQNHCPNRTVLGIVGRNGAFAEFLSLPLANLHRVPDNVPDELAVFVEPLAAAYRIPEQIPIEPGLKVVVLGDGRLGNLCAQVLAECGAQVLVVGKHEAKLRLLSDLAIATARLEGVEADCGRRPPCDLVVDATGSETGLPLALRLVRPRGTVVLKTTVANRQTLALAPIVIDETTVLGSRCGPFEPALAALSEGRIDVRPLISSVRSLDEGVEAFAEAATAGVLKVQLTVEPQARL